MDNFDTKKQLRDLKEYESEIVVFDDMLDYKRNHSSFFTGRQRKDSEVFLSHSFLI